VSKTENTEVTRVIKIPKHLLLRLEKLRRLYGFPKGDQALLKAISIGVQFLEEKEGIGST